MQKNNTLSALVAASAFTLSLALSPAFVSADGMFDDRPKPKRAPVAAPIAPPVMLKAPVAAPMEVKPVAVVEEACGCTNNMRLSGGLPVMFFNQESANRPLAAMALDFWCDELPVNFRVGVEGRHMYVGQSSADFAREFDDKTTRITFIRIPFAAEYMTSLGESTTGYIGGGPDIITTANDFSEVGVGMHLGARVHYAFTKELGVSLEGGYMWGSVDGQGGRDVRFDGAYVSPMLAYTF